MANYFSSKYYVNRDKLTLDRSENLPNANASIEGGMCTWVVGTALTATRTYTVLNFSKGRYSQYPSVKEIKPHIMIKCAVDTSVNNAIIADAAGSTIFTFAADYSVTPAYVVLRLSTTNTWELA